jgi:hypothetical protein
MDHAEVVERIEAAVAGPGGLARLNADASPAAAELRAHVAGCPACAAEWRAWSVVSLGLAAAAPEALEPRAGLRDQVLAAAAARPRSPAAAPEVGVVMSTGAPVPSPTAGSLPSPSTTVGGGTRSGIALGARRPRGGPTTAPPPAAAGAPRFRWLLMGAAAVVVLFVAGMILGRQLAGSPETQRGDPGRVLAEAATILQGGGYGLARLETPDGQPGGVVVVSPGSGRLAVWSTVLPAPPDGERYGCWLERDGSRTWVGPMNWTATVDGNGLAHWAGEASPSDLGLPGDVFIVQLDSEGSQPALTGEFVG